MATMTKAPEYYGYRTRSGWSGWRGWNPTASESFYKNGSLGYRDIQFRYDIPFQGMTITAVAVDVTLMNETVDVGITKCTLFNGDYTWDDVLGTENAEVSGEQTTNKTFRFQGLNISPDRLCFEFSCLTDGVYFQASNISITLTYSVPALGLTITPTTVYVDNYVSLGILNRLDQTVTVEFWYNDTRLDSFITEDDQTAVYCPDSWFDTAAYSGSSMRVTVRLSDTLGRTANGNFTLIRPEGSTATPIAPRSTKLDGAKPINFSWQTDESWGAQTGAELQWSTDNAVWSALAVIDDNASAWTAPALKFPAGTIYWRVRVQNAYGKTGPWSGSASFTAEYSATSQVQPVNSPTSGVINAGIDRTFSVRLRATGPVYSPFTVASATFYWRSRSSGPYTALAMTPDGSYASVLIPAGTFPVGEVQWYAEATDNVGTTTLTDTYTLSTLTADVQAVPLAPIDTVESGSGEIVFRWSYGSIDGSPQGAAEIQTSADGEAWETLATVTGANAREYTAAAYTFSAGAVYWRIRAKTETGDYGPWSEAVSFVCYSAPLVEGVMADSAPWATITWQTSGQLAYEIEVDGEGYGPFFGAEDRAFTLLEPLADGTHTVRVRAQNKYSLWSEWESAEFAVHNNAESPTITLRAEAGEDAALTWRGGSSVNPPPITVQPTDMSTEDGLCCFAVAADGAELRYQWETLAAGSASWTVLDGETMPVLSFPANEELDGSAYRCIVSNAAGDTASDAAVYSFAAPSSAPVIAVQPVTVTKNSGTADFICGANGSAYQWYIKYVDHGSGSYIAVTDGGSGLWRIPYGNGEIGDIALTDGTNPWHIMSGAGESGDVVLTDGTDGAWHLPAGFVPEPEWVPMEQETGPVLSIAAISARDGNQFYCEVTNAEGTVNSDVVQYIFGAEPEEAIPGDYYVFRDGELIARRTDPGYTDRTALGEHSYRVLNRLDNNRYIYSNTVTVTITVGCLMIAPLAGGAWQRLRLSDREVRAFRFNRTRKVAYVHYSGSRYPEAEVGEEEDLTGGFDVSWRYEDRDEADAFEALIGEQVVLKTPRDVVMTGVLQGFERDDPRFYKAYTFELRQDDWRPMEDA